MSPGTLYLLLFRKRHRWIWLFCSRCMLTDWQRTCRLCLKEEPWID